MASFPILKTGAVLQYPAARGIRYQNEAVRFVDGTEQRYRDCAGPLRRWQIVLSQLDESEMAEVEAFFAENQGAFGTFAFTDPWDGQIYGNCTFERDEAALEMSSEMSGGVRLMVVERRGESC